MKRSRGAASEPGEEETARRRNRRQALALGGAAAAAATVAALGMNGSRKAHAATGDAIIIGQFNEADPGDNTTLSGDVDGAPALRVENHGTAGAIQGQSWKGGAPAIDGIGNTGVRGEGSEVGVRAIGSGAGTIGLLAKNTPDRRALRTEGQVEMDCARTEALSAKSTEVTLPAGTTAGSNAIVMATVQGNPGNNAVISRAYRVDSTHICIVFNKKPARPTKVGYWVVHTV
jgi:hypothetical protein